MCETKKELAKKITKEDVLSSLDEFLDNYTSGLLAYRIEYIKNIQAIHIFLYRGKKRWSYYAVADFCIIGDLFVYLEDIFLELYKKFDIPNAEEEYEKRRTKNGH